MTKLVFASFLLGTLLLAGCKKPENGVGNRIDAVSCAAGYRIMLEYADGPRRERFLAQKESMEALAQKQLGDQAEAEVSQAQQDLSQYLGRIRRESGPGAPAAHLVIRHAHCSQLR